jgi:surface antigen Omp85-like protein
MQMITRRLVSILFFLACLLPAASAVQAQAVTATLRLQATAVNVSGALVWQVNMQLAPTDIVIDASTMDPSLATSCPQISVALRNRLLKELAVMAKEEKDSLRTSTPVHFYIDSIPPSYSVPDALGERAIFRRLDHQITPSVSTDGFLGLNTTAPLGFGPPTRTGETLAERNLTQWRIELNPKSFAVVSYQLSLRTQNAADDDANAVMVSKTMGDIASDLGIESLTADEKAVAVTLVYAPGDLQKPDGTTRTEAEVIRVLESAAYQTFLVLRDEKMQPCQFRDSQIRDVFQSRVGNLFNAYPGLNVDSSLNDDNQEIFGVSGLQIVNSVRISVTPEPDPQGNTTVTDRDKEIEELLNTQEKPRLLAQPGLIVTNDILEKDTRRLYLVRSVSAFPKYSFDAGVLTYEVTRRREIVNLTVTGAGSYSPEYALNGSLGVTGDNLLGRNESLSLTLTGGNSFQKGQFSFSIPRETPKERRKIPIIFAGFDLSANYNYDSDEHLGNPLLTKYTNRESQISARVSFEYDSFTDLDYVALAEGITDKRKRLHHLVTTDAGFDVLNNQLKSDGLIPVAPLDGRVVYPSLKLRYLATYDLRRPAKRGGLGEIDFLLTATGQKGFTGLGGDFSYRQYELTGGAQLFFGFAAPTDLFLRYQRGVGASSNGTPLFKIFRLGGPLNVRGLEEGEFVGNSYAYDRTEFGVALLPLVRTLSKPFSRGKKSTDTTPAEESAPPNFGGIDLANTYVKIFYDRGRLFDSKSLGEILNPAHGVKGWGIAAELRGIAIIKNKRANLTIGYARSNDSLLHRRGTIVTGLSLDF